MSRRSLDVSRGEGKKEVGGVTEGEPSVEEQYKLNEYSSSEDEEEEKGDNPHVSGGL